MDLAAYRTAVKVILESTYDSDVWNNATVDAGIVQALREVEAAGPILEGTFTVTTAGRSQDLGAGAGAISAIRSVFGVSWPWSTDYAGWAPAAAFRHVAEDTVWIEDGEPAVGDLIRVRYQCRMTIDDLESATATTVPASFETWLVQGAAGYAALVRARQDIEGSSLPGYAAKNYMEWGKARVVEMLRGIVSLTAPPLISWGRMGL